MIVLPLALFWVPHWGMLVQNMVRTLGSVVKHQGNSWPSGFRQKFSLRSLHNKESHPIICCKCMQVGGWASECVCMCVSDSLAGVGLRYECVVMGILWVPALASESRGCYIDCPSITFSSAPVTLGCFHHAAFWGRFCKRAKRWSLYQTAYLCICLFVYGLNMFIRPLCNISGFFRDNQDI